MTDFDAMSVVADREAAEGYVAKVCFKTGPPEQVGVELEWTVHHDDDHTRTVSAEALATALGDHAPQMLRAESPHHPLPGGGLVTVEPGGQVEISTPPNASLRWLIGDTAADVAHLERLLTQAGLRLGSQACDPYRLARRMLHSERYLAMERVFDRVGAAGRVMMSATAGLQICLDAGEAHRVHARWDALHALGPALIALFANSPRYAGHDTGWASHRMRTWYRLDPVRTSPPVTSGDPIAAWAERVLETPLLCIRRAGGCWDAPTGVTFADWIDGALDTRPTFDDLWYHIGTLFPPVRARGYFEVRYLDAQPGDDWLVPVATLAAIFAREDSVDAAAEIAAPAAQRWISAAHLGLADPVIASVVPRLVDLGCRALSDTDLPADVVAVVSERLSKKGGNL